MPSIYSVDLQKELVSQSRFNSLHYFSVGVNLLFMGHPSHYTYGGFKKTTAPGKNKALQNEELIRILPKGLKDYLNLYSVRT